MKKIILLSLISTLSFASIVKESFFINDPNHIYLNMIKSHKSLTLDHLNKHGYELYGPIGTKKWLDEIKLDYQNLENLEQELVLSSYPSSEDVYKNLKAVISQYPDFLAYEVIGHSAGNQEIIAVKISDNVQKDELEPEVKLVANIHGNEIMGREVLIQFIEDIAKNYQTDVAIKELVDSTEIYIIPTLNPDGADKKRRGNKNWVDLNRNFPDFTTGNGDQDNSNREVEVQAMMSFQSKRNFALSFNYHGGAVVVNYPWDTKKELHPENNLVLDISKSYATNTNYFLKESRFQDAVVNGYQWYEVNGGMQDWSYHWHNDLQVTIEVSKKKWPKYSKRNWFYEENKPAIMQFIKSAHHGFGLSVSTGSKIEIEDVGIFYANNDEFYKVLSPGSYKYKVNGKASTITIPSDYRLESPKYIQIKKPL